jgi:glucan phosphoethanolaminetransferase (alkaline phosphatase superfamily)
MLRKLGIQTQSKRERISLGLSTIVVFAVLGYALVDLKTHGLQHYWWSGSANVAIGILGLWVWVIFHRRLLEPKRFVLRCSLGFLLALVMLFDVVTWFWNIYRSAAPTMQFLRPLQSVLMMVLFFILFCRRNLAR